MLAKVFMSPSSLITVINSFILFPPSFPPSHSHKHSFNHVFNSLFYDLYTDAFIYVTIHKVSSWTNIFSVSPSVMGLFRDLVALTEALLPYMTYSCKVIEIDCWVNGILVKTELRLKWKFCSFDSMTGDVTIKAKEYFLVFNVKSSF